MKKYEIDGKKVPSLNQILDNCKIGGIGNLLYRANQSGLAGRTLQDKVGDTNNAGWLATQRIRAHLDGEEFDSSEYSDNCHDRSRDAYHDYRDWSQSIKLCKSIKDMRLVSEIHEYGDTFDVYRYDVGDCLVMVLMQNEVYPENLVRLAADVALMKANGMDIKTTFIIQINNPKHHQDPVSFTVHEYDDLSYPMSVFIEMRKIYEMSETLKTLV